MCGWVGGKVWVWVWVWVDVQSRAHESKHFINPICVTVNMSSYLSAHQSLNSCISICPFLYVGNNEKSYVILSCINKEHVSWHNLEEWGKKQKQTSISRQHFPVPSFTATTKEVIGPLLSLLLHASSHSSVKEAESSVFEELACAMYML